VLILISPCHPRVTVDGNGRGNGVGEEKGRSNGEAKGEGSGGKRGGKANCKPTMSKLLLFSFPFPFFLIVFHR
jgi:hypothetical protein